MTAEPLRRPITLRGLVRCVHVRVGVYAALVTSAAAVVQFVIR